MIEIITFAGAIAAGLGGLAALVYYSIKIAKDVFGLFSKSEMEKLIHELPEILEDIPLTISLNQPVNIPELIKSRIPQLEKLAGERTILKNVEFLIKLGNIEYYVGNYPRALTYYTEALQQAEITDNKWAIAAGMGNAGVIHFLKGHSKTALEHQEMALEIDREIGYRQGEASALGNIGNVYSVKGDLDRALDHYRKSLKTHREIGYRQGEANALVNIGFVKKQRGDSKAALKYLGEALEILDKHDLAHGKDVVLKAIKEIKSQKKA